MATRQVFIDDLNGSEDGVETIVFAIDGQNYQIDLGVENQDRLRGFLAEFCEAAVMLDRNGNPARGKQAANRKTLARQQLRTESGSVAAAPAPAGELPKFDVKTARAWLREHELPVPDRGKLRAEVVQPYLESDDYKAWAEANL